MRFNEIDKNVFESGKKIKLKSWKKAYWYQSDRGLMNHDEDGIETPIALIFDHALGWVLFGDWEVVEEPDSKPKTEPKFEENKAKTFNFGKALRIIKSGGRVARAGWNGKNQYVEAGYNIVYERFSGETVHAENENIGSMALVFVGTSGIQIGWLASQADMIAEDWYEVKKENK